MSVLQPNTQTGQATATIRAEPVRDASGCAIFSAGDAGAAHVMAHRMSDENRVALGHRLLGEWLKDRTGSGSEWIHLQFHMAVFELELGDWEAAYSRFQDHVLPVAATSEDALTDAPALLWRLALSAPRAVELPWQPLRRTALARMERPSDPFVALHNLLALAGAGDLENLDRWLHSQRLDESTQRESLVWRLGVALKAYATGTYRRAAKALENLIPQLAQLGGSRAQNQLFIEIARSSWPRIDQARLTPFSPKSA